MEIADYLRIARRRLWVLILIPLVAGTAATAYVLQSPIEYSAEATLSTTSFVGGTNDQYTGTQAAGQFAAAFTATATGPAVLATASDQADVPVSKLSSGLTVAQDGASSNMTLTFTDEAAARIIPALKALNEATLNSMFGPQVALARSELAAAQTKSDQEQARLGEYVATYGRGDTRTRIQQRVVNTAYHNLRLATTAYTTAASQLNATHGDGVLFIKPVHAQDRKAAVVKTVVPVVGAAIFLAVILVMMLEMLASARQRSGAAHGASERDSYRRGPGTEPLPQSD